MESNGARRWTNCKDERRVNEEKKVRACKLVRGGGGGDGDGQN